MTSLSTRAPLPLFPLRSMSSPMMKVLFDSNARTHLRSVPKFVKPAINYDPKQYVTDRLVIEGILY